MCSISELLPIVKTTKHCKTKVLDMKDAVTVNLATTYSACTERMNQ